MLVGLVLGTVQRKGIAAFPFPFPFQYPYPYPYPYPIQIGRDGFVSCPCPGINVNGMGRECVANDFFQCRQLLNCSFIVAQETDLVIVIFTVIAGKWGRVQHPKPCSCSLTLTPARWRLDSRGSLRTWPTCRSKSRVSWCSRRQKT
jgi:hypothetical protein